MGSRKRFALLVVGAGAGASLLALALTMTPPPGPSLTDEIDRLLDQDPCVGSVDQWPSRYYVWGATSWRNGLEPIWAMSAPWLGSDTSRVRVMLIKGARPGDYPPGRHRLRADQDRMGLDDSDFMIAAGTYDVRTRRLSDWMCGPSNR